MRRNDPMQLDPDLINIGGTKTFVPFTDLDLSIRRLPRRSLLLVE
jgi:hypothetical protein